MKRRARVGKKAGGDGAQEGARDLIPFAVALRMDTLFLLPPCSEWSVVCLVEDDQTRALRPVVVGTAGSREAAEAAALAYGEATASEGIQAGGSA